MPPRELVERPLRSDDRNGVAALLARLSPESLFQRFHSGGVKVDEAVVDAVTVGRALVSEVDERLVGLALRRELV